MDEIRSRDESEPDARQRASRSRKMVTAALTAIAVGVGGVTVASIASAASPSPSPTPSQSPEGNPPRSGHGGKHSFGRGIGGLHALHGTFVVPRSDGGYQTVHVQRGDVTKVSTSSITLRSADGFTKTYVVTADTLVNAARDGISTVRVGDEAHVTAVEANGRVAAVSITDRTRIASGWRRFAPPGRPDSPAVR